MISKSFQGQNGQINASINRSISLDAIFSMVRKNGIHDYVRVKDDVAAQEIINSRLKVRNEQLFAEINDLNDGQDAIEERARTELGMIKPGESFYRMVKESNNQKASNNQ